MWVKIRASDVAVSIKPEDVPKLNSGDSLECRARNRLGVDSLVKLTIDDKVKSTTLEEPGFHMESVCGNPINVYISNEVYRRIIENAIFVSRCGPDQVCIHYFGPENEYGKNCDLG